jgi:porphobilinogen deaminase
MTSECEQRLAVLWASLDDHDEHEFVQRMDELVGELPADSAVGCTSARRRSTRQAGGRV